MYKILYIVLLMFASLCAYANEAQPLLDLNNLPASRLDFGRQIIEFIAASGGNGITGLSLASVLSKSINLIGLTIMSALAVVGAATFVIQTGNKGTPGGQVVSSFWAPIRITAATILLIPLGSGYSTIQYGVITIAEKSNGLANYVMGAGLDYIYTNGNYTPPALEDSSQVILGWISSEVCMKYINSVTETEWISRQSKTEDRWSAKTFTYSYDVNENPQSSTKSDPRRGYCGALSVQAVSEEIIPDKKSYQFAGTEIVRDKFRAVITETQKEVSEIADLILSDQESLAALQKHGASAQGKFENDYLKSDGSVQTAAERYVSLTRAFNSKTASILATTVNQISADNAGVSWVEETKDSGWPALGTVFWQNIVTQQRINGLAKSLTISYHQPEVDNDFDKDERFIEMSMRVRGLSKFANNIPRPLQNMEGANLVAISNAGQDGTADGLKKLIVNASQAIGRSLVIGDLNSDLVVTLQNSGSQITTFSEAAWTAIVFAQANAQAIAKAADRVIEGVKNGVSRIPIVGSIFSSAASVIGGAGTYATEVASGTVKGMGDLIKLLLVPIMIAGVTLAVVLPAIPLMLWFFGVVSWMLFFIECLIVSPIWLSAHGAAERDGWGSEHTRQGYMLMIGLFIGPAFRVVGFLLIILALRPINLLVGWFFSYVHGVLITSWISPLIIAASLLLCCAFAYTILVRAFSLPNELFEKCLRWVNGGQEVTGERDSEGGTRGTLAGGLVKAEAAGDRTLNKAEGMKPTNSIPKMPGAPPGGTLS